MREDRALAQLHAKFWGKSMAEEEEQWRRAQPRTPTIGGELGDEDQDGDERMDEDQGERTDLEDDILPGCYVLDIGIDCSRIWVRAEYIRMYNFLESYYHEVTRKPGPAPGAVLTGQPGIGEFLHRVM